MKSLKKTPIYALLGGLCWGLGTHSTLNAQGFSDFQWKDAQMQAGYTIPNEFAKADAVIIRNETYSKGIFSGEFPYIEQLATLREQTHLKILTQKALDEYKRLEIPRFKGQIADYVQLKEYDIRIKKKDGSQKDYVVKDLPKIELAEDDKLYDSREDYYFFAVNDLEIGDEIEIVSVIESKFLDNGRLVTLYQEYPSLESRFVISIPNKVGLIGSVYNKMPAPETRVVGEQTVYSWTQKNLAAVPEANSAGSIVSTSLDHFVYELNFDKFRASEFIPKNFRDLGLQFMDDYLLSRIANKSKLEEFYANLFKDKNSTLEKAVALNDYVVKNIKLVGRRDLGKDNDFVDLCLINKRTDNLGIMKIYRDFFTRYKIPFYLGFAKDRFSGAFDFKFLSSTQIADYFFVFETEDGGMFTLMGLNGVNEIAPSLTGVPFYLINLKDISKKDLESLEFPNDALKSLDDNQTYGSSNFDIKLATNTATMKNTTSIMGCYSTEQRNGYINMYKKDSLVKLFQNGYENNNSWKKHEPQVSSALVKEFELMPPYPFKVEHIVSLKNITQQKGEEYSLELKNFISHNLRNVNNADARVLDYHVDYMGKEIENIILTFDKDIVVSNLSSLTTNISNEYGSYTCTAMQPKPNIIQIKSTYTIKQLFVEKTKCPELDALNKAAKNVRDTKLQIKAK